MPMSLRRALGLFAQGLGRRQPQPTLSIAAHQHEVLSTDWCKYNDCVLATGSVDKSIKIWDIRSPQREVTSLLGHT